MQALRSNATASAARPYRQCLLAAPLHVYHHTDAPGARTRMPHCATPPNFRYSRTPQSIRPWDHPLAAISPRSVKSQRQHRNTRLVTSVATDGPRTLRTWLQRILPIRRAAMALDRNLTSIRRAAWTRCASSPSRVPATVFSASNATVTDASPARPMSVLAVARPALLAASWALAKDLTACSSLPSASCNSPNSSNLHDFKMNHSLQREQLPNHD